MKRKEYALVFIGMTMLEGLYFVWQPYTKGILRLGLFWGQANAVPDLITNIFYYAVYFSAFLMIAHYCFGGGDRQDRKILWKRYAGIAGLLYILRSAFDIVNIFFEFTLPPMFTPIAHNAAEVLFIFAMMYILYRKIAKPQGKMRECIWNKWIVVGAMAALAVCFVWTVMCNVQYMLSVQYLANKYQVFSEILVGVAVNYDFYSKVNSLILGAVAGAAIFTAFMQVIVPGKKEKKGEGLSSKVRKGVIYALRLGAILGAFVLLREIKGVVMPVSSIWQTQALSKSSTNYTGRMDFTADNNEVIFTRFMGAGKESEIFHNLTIHMKCGNDIKLSFDSFHNEIFLDTIDIPGVTASRYETQAVIYLQDSQPVALLLKDVKKQGESEVLTKILEKMISQGYWNFGYSYLLKYDRDFILPYIEWYAAGKFSASEMEINKEINPDFMQGFAKGIQKATHKS